MLRVCPSIGSGAATSATGLSTLRRKPAIVLGLMAAMLAASMVFLALPATLHAGNSDEFVWPLLSVLLTYRPFALSLGLACVLPTLLLPRRLALLWAAGCSAVALYLWAYGTFVVYDFGLIDGRNWRIQPHPAGMAVEALLVVAALIAAFVVARRNPGAVAGALSVLVLGNGLSAASAIHADSRTPPPSMELSSLYRFSEEKNVLVVLLDSMQSDIFEEVVRENPDLEGALEGFTFYADTAGVAPSTYLTMPAIHSGLVYDGASSMRGYFEEGVRRKSFLNELSRKGYESVLVNPTSGLCPERVRVCATDTEVLGGGSSASLVRDAASLLDLVLLRVAPLGLKRSVYNEGRWRLAPLVEDPRLAHHVVRGNNLLGGLAAKLSAARRAPTAKFLHLFGTHLPMVLDQRCVFRAETVRWSRDNYKVQVGCSLEAFRALLAALRREGVYDSTAIALLADHGTGMESARVAPEASAPVNPMIVGLANPTLAFKPMNAKGQFRRSNDLVSIADVSAIICEDVGDCVGRRRAPGAGRAYGSFVWRQSYIKEDHIPGIVGYEIRGSLFDTRNWHRIDDSQVGSRGGSP